MVANRQNNGYKTKLFFLVILWFFLSGQAAVYKRYGYDHIGFYSSQVDKDAYRVSFVASEEETYRRLGDFVLLRCAEITREAGFRYFIVRENYYNEDSYGMGLKERKFTSEDRERYKKLFKGLWHHTLTYVIQCFEDVPDDKKITVYDAAATAKRIRETYGIKNK